MNISRLKKYYALLLLLVMVLKPILGLAATAWPEVAEQVPISTNIVAESSENCHEREMQDGLSDLQTQAPARGCCEELCQCHLGTCHAPVATFGLDDLMLNTHDSDTILMHSFYINPSLSDFNPPPIH